MKKLFLSGFLALASVLAINAQKAGYDPVNAPFGHGEDSVKCRMSLSLMSTSAKAENYKDALNSWNDVYENCPASSKNIYIYGPRIFKSLNESETDAAKKKEYLDKVMDIYTKRLQYYPDDNKGTVLAYKTYDYMEMVGTGAESKVIYEWLGEAIEDMKSRMEPKDAYSYYMVASLNLFRSNESFKDNYINDYFRVTGYVDEAIEIANKDNDQANADYLALVKDGIVKGFIASGAGDCKTLTEYYGDKIEPNKGDQVFLTEVVSALSSLGCSDTDIYFTAAEHLYRLEPSAGAALGLANKSLKDKDYDTAIKYYQEAADLESDPSKSSSYMMQLAGIFSNQRNFSKSRQAANEALKYNPNNGDAYILIAQLYATSAESIFSEREKRGLVFCAAVDKLNRAKAVDPEVASKAQGLINQYSAYFMDTETAFMMGIKAGESVSIPGWIGETTTVRLK